jgi:hypothetical protein
VRRLTLFSPQSGWKESHTTFVYELKNLQATGLSSFGRALKESFQLLNLHRLHNCIDNYGQGRNPFFLEPAVIIALTDSAKLTNEITVEDEKILYQVLVASITPLDAVRICLNKQKLMYKVLAPSTVTPISNGLMEDLESGHIMCPRLVKC